MGRNKCKYSKYNLSNIDPICRICGIDTTDNFQDAIDDDDEDLKPLIFGYVNRPQKVICKDCFITIASAVDDKIDERKKDDD